MLREKGTIDVKGKREHMSTPGLTYSNGNLRAISCANKKKKIAANEQLLIVFTK